MHVCKCDENYLNEGVKKGDERKEDSKEYI